MATEQNDTTNGTESQKIERYIFRIDGYEIDFLDGRLWLSHNPPLFDLGYVKALQLAITEFACIFNGLDMIRRAGKSYRPSTWQHFSDELLEEIVVQWGVWGKSSRIQWTTDIIEMIPYIQAEYKNRLHRTASKVRVYKAVPGYVYLLQSSTGYYKIGRTKDPQNRLATFSVKLPFEVEYEHIISSSNMNKLERKLHALFADKRVNGEWFDLSPDDVAYIKSMGGEK
jgi:hypothetical protein